MPLHGKRAIVMGLGRFGGGAGVARFLVGRGAQVLVTDTADPATLAPSVARLADLPNITYRLGEHREQDFTAADLVVVNPAVKPGENRYLQAARDAGAAISSEIRLLVAHLPNRQRTIGITGSAGKSTVTAMVGHILRKVRDRGTEADAEAHGFHPWASGATVHVGGNLGGSLLGELDRIAPDDWVVLELSSFMLEGLRADRWSPSIAAVTNLAPNHLDWHGSVEAYAAAKQAIFEHQQIGDQAVLGPNLLAPIHALVPAHRVAQPAEDELTALPLPGAHNRLNAAMACRIALCAGVDEAAAIAALSDFTGLPHRLQLVAEHAGVRYFNDSKSTTPEAAMLAIDSFEPGRVHLLLGGYDKGADLSALARHAAARCGAIYTLGATGPAVANAAEADAGQAQVVRCGDLERAVAAAVGGARAGDVVVLSPGCASWDQFDNYEQRGARFTEAVLRHAGDG